MIGRHNFMDERSISSIHVREMDIYMYLCMYKHCINNLHKVQNNLRLYILFFMNTMQKIKNHKYRLNPYRFLMLNISISNTKNCSVLNVLLIMASVFKVVSLFYNRYKYL